MPLFGAPDVEKLEARRDVAGLIKALGYEKDVYVQQAAAGALGRIGDSRAVEPLANVVTIVAQLAAQLGPRPESYALYASNWDMRMVALSLLFGAAAEALGRMGDPRAVDPLVATLMTPNDQIQDAAATALSQLGWQPDGSAAGVRVMVKRHEWDKCVAAGAPAVAPLVEALDDDEPTVRRGATAALVRIGAPAVDALVDALEDPRQTVRQGATAALTGIGTPAVASLKKAARHRGSDQGEAALEILAKAGWKPDDSEAGAILRISRREWDDCAQIGAPAVWPLISSLRDPDPSVRHGAATALARIGAPAVRPLTEILCRDDREMCQSAASILGQIGDPAAVPALLNAVLTSDRDVRQAVAEALVAIGAPAVEPLIRDLCNPYSHSRPTMAWALGQIGDPRAVEPLIAGLSDMTVHEAAVRALGIIGDARAVDPLIAVLRGAGSGSEAAAQALAVIGDPAAGSLVAVLGVSSPVVRKAAVDALVSIGAPAVEPLVTAMKTDPQVREVAGQALAGMAEPHAIDLLVRALRESDADIRQAAATALARNGWTPTLDRDGAAYRIARKEWAGCVEIGAPAVEQLIAALDSVDRESAARALGEIGDARAVDPLVEVVKGDSRRARQVAAQALGQIGDMRAKRPLIEMLTDSDDVTRGVAAEALTKLGWTPTSDQDGALYWIVRCGWAECAGIGSAAVEPLVAALGYLGLVDSAEAIRTLGEIGEARAVEPLKAVLESGFLTIRPVAAEALGRIGDPIAIEPLVLALDQGDWSLRKAAAGAMVALYQTGRLDGTLRQLILDRREVITCRHEDDSVHTDETDWHPSDCSTHNDFGTHTDHGVGVAFRV